MATGPGGSGRSVTASDRISSPISRKIRPRRLGVAHQSNRAPIWGSEFAECFPDCDGDYRPSDGDGETLGQRHAASDASEAPRTGGYSDQVKLCCLKAGLLQAIACHNRQDRGMPALEILLKAHDDGTPRDDGRRTPGNG